MKAIWTRLVAALALAIGASLPALAKPAQTFPFACEIDLGQLKPADLGRYVPENHRGEIFLENGQKKCTFSASQNSEISCVTEIDDWPNPKNVTIKDFVQPCQWLLIQSQCDIDAKVVATEQSFKIKKVDSDTARLELDCKGKSR